MNPSPRPISGIAWHIGILLFLGLVASMSVSWGLYRAWPGRMGFTGAQLSPVWAGGDWWFLEHRAILGREEVCWERIRTRVPVHLHPRDFRESAPPWCGPTHWPSSSKGASFIMEFATGWPLPCLAGARVIVETFPGGEFAEWAELHDTGDPLPMRPLAVPIVVNTFFFGALLAAVWGLRYLPRGLRALRHAMFRRRAVCLRCRYSLRNLPLEPYSRTIRCPECGLEQRGRARIVLGRRGRPCECCRYPLPIVTSSEPAALVRCPMCGHAQSASASPDTQTMPGSTPPEPPQPRARRGRALLWAALAAFLLLLPTGWVTIGGPLGSFFIVLGQATLNIEHHTDASKLARLSWSVDAHGAGPMWNFRPGYIRMPATGSITRRIWEIPLWPLPVVLAALGLLRMTGIGTKRTARNEETR